jgi:hypothetical protein
MKYTLLEMTQEILSNMSSDEVNSIGDTSESLQVATIIRQKYFDIINRLELPDHYQMVQLNPSTTTAEPTLMYVPDGVQDIKWIKYYDSNVLDGNSNTSVSTHAINVDLTSTPTTGIAPPGYLYVPILPFQQFIDMVGAFNKADTDVSTYTFTDTSNGFNTSYEIKYKTSGQPKYCTILSNYYVFFDSFDKTQDDTLQASKTLAYGAVIPVFKMEDSFIPDLAEEQFPLLLNESKSLAFFELKQQPHPLASQEVRRGWSTIQKKKAVVNRPSYFDELANFGRRRAYFGYRGGLTNPTNTGPGYYY